MSDDEVDVFRGDGPTVRPEFVTELEERLALEWDRQAADQRTRRRKGLALSAAAVAGVALAGLIVAALWPTSGAPDQLTSASPGTAAPSLTTTPSSSGQTVVAQTSPTDPLGPPPAAVGSWVVVEVDGAPWRHGRVPDLEVLPDGSMRGFDGCNVFSARIASDQPVTAPEATAGGSAILCEPPYDTTIVGPPTGAIDVEDGHLVANSDGHVVVYQRLDSFTTPDHPSIVGDWSNEDEHVSFRADGTMMLNDCLGTWSFDGPASLITASVDLATCPTPSSDIGDVLYVGADPVVGATGDLYLRSANDSLTVRVHRR